MNTLNQIVDFCFSSSLSHVHNGGFIYRIGAAVTAVSWEDWWTYEGISGESQFLALFLYIYIPIIEYI